MEKNIVITIARQYGSGGKTIGAMLAKELGISVTAEGVETKNQVDFLTGINCDNIQGFYYSKPLCLNDFNQLLA